MVPLLIAMLLGCCGLQEGARDCGTTATHGEFPHGANETPTYTFGRLRRIQGIVVRPDETPVELAVVELYRLEKGEGWDLRTELYGGKPRIKAVLTGADGTFCFPGLHSGRYLLVIGTSKQGELNDARAIVTISTSSTLDTEMRIELSLGT